MLCQEDNSISPRAKLSDVLIVISDVFCFRALNEKLLFDFDGLLLHHKQIYPISEIQFT